MTLTVAKRGKAISSTILFSEEQVNGLGGMEAWPGEALLGKFVSFKEQQQAPLECPVTLHQVGAHFLQFLRPGSTSRCGCSHTNS